MSNVSRPAGAEFSVEGHLMAPDGHPAPGDRRPLRDSWPQASLAGCPVDPSLRIVERPVAPSFVECPVDPSLLIADGYEQDCALACRSLPGATASRLRELLGWSPASAAVERLRSPSSDAALRALGVRWPQVGAGFAESFLTELIDEASSQRLALGLTVRAIGDPGYPSALAIDPAAPPVIVMRGSTSALSARRVAIIGTRNATPGGVRVARALAEDLAAVGVTVVSGLARGIDGAAHDGVRRAAAAGASPLAVAIVGSGPDVPFPRSNRDLWEWVAGHGLLVSEHPPGTEPMAAHFPQRNRIIAALSELVVVVESRETGGSMITVREALRRGVGVLAVPGSVLSPAARGTNSLIADGAVAARDAADVLVALGLDTSRSATLPFDPRPDPSIGDRAVLAAFGGDTLTIDEVSTRLALPVRDLAVAIGRLEATGWVHDVGGWYQPIGPREAGR